ncbi:hypothetical protein [Butyricicoccus sp. AM05-1]|uniref:hypothetical protein n=1 Tax=Butyricicoccus sp. AM05-1 TaxID=2292004 RepID=UPI001FAA01A5|nr:hypothetical protein [Butyricicoccus sp. AM05-1]
MKEKTKWNNYDALPLILDVTDIQHIMGISRASAYELVHTHRGFLWCVVAG